MRTRLLLLFLLFVAVKSHAQTYAVAADYTPVLNTYDFFLVFGGNDGKSVKLRDGLIDEMEFIALPGTAFNIHEVIVFEDRNLKYFKVTTDDYDYKGNFYVDSRMVDVYYSPPDARRKKMPGQVDILKELNRLTGYPYMWGGNCADGIKRMLKLYKPKEKISKETESLWTLRGVDCSGLLYQATNGCTPRNTSSLATFGNTVDIEGKSIDEIISLLKPLDLIVLKGHVVIVYDKEYTVESSPNIGVHKTEIKTRLEKLYANLQPANDFSKSSRVFVVRRWY
ncbi:MAG: peptidoglycan endopeptidase [Ignavibacteria bacterium]|nr:peptidoglycan endopeptidase [Ignavibacteria bacterium]